MSRTLFPDNCEHRRMSQAKLVLPIPPTGGTIHTELLQICPIR